jgi:hypothetical protein
VQILLMGICIICTAGVGVIAPRIWRIEQELPDAA